MKQYSDQQASDNDDYQQNRSGVELTLVTTKVDVVGTQGTTRERAGGVLWGDAVETYLNSAIDSANTRRAYGRALRQAGVALGVEHVDDIAGADLAHYRSQVVSSGLAVASQQQTLAAVRSFLSWLNDLGGLRLSARHIAVALKTPKGGSAATYAVVNEKEIAAMFATAIEPRRAALLSVLVGAGLEGLRSGLSSDRRCCRRPSGRILTSRQAVEARQKQAGAGGTRGTSDHSEVPGEQRSIPGWSRCSLLG